MECEYCFEKFGKNINPKTGVDSIDEVQVLERGVYHLVARCWNCGQATLFLQQGSLFNKAAQYVRKRRIEQYKDDLQNKSIADGMAFEEETDE